MYINICFILPISHMGDTHFSGSQRWTIFITRPQEKISLGNIVLRPLYFLVKFNCIWELFQILRVEDHHVVYYVYPPISRNLTFSWGLVEFHQSWFISWRWAVWNPPPGQIISLIISYKPSAFRSLLLSQFTSVPGSLWEGNGHNHC